MPNFSICLWFDSQAEEAANLYCGLFPNSRILSTSRYSEDASKASGQPAGSVMTVDFELDGRPFMGLNGGPVFKHSEAMSIMVTCKDPSELDRYWNALTSDGGEESMCGWLKDKFGVSWQIIPEPMDGWMKSENGDEVMKAMLQMRKLDWDALERAAKG